MIPIMMPNASWGLGPSLLYFFGMLGALVWVMWLFGRGAMDRGQTHEEAAEQRKSEAFTNALIRDAKRRKEQG